MTEREQITQKANPKPMTAAHVRNEPFPDPEEPKARHAGLTLGLIIGSIFLTMIIVMIGAFIYFQNNTEGPTSLISPAAAILLGL